MSVVALAKVSLVYIGQAVDHVTSVLGDVPALVSTLATGSCDLVSVAAGHVSILAGHVISYTCVAASWTYSSLGKLSIH